jgi:predicted ATPase
MNIEDVVIPRYTCPVVGFYKNDGTHLGDILNEHEFNKLRHILFEHSLTGGVYFMWNEMKITLNERGEMSDFPVGLYDELARDLAKFFKLRRERGL